MLRGFLLTQFSRLGASLLILGLLVPPLPVFGQTTNSAAAPATAQPSASEPASDNAPAVAEFDIGPLARAVFESVDSSEESLSVAVEENASPPDDAAPEEEQPKEEEPPPEPMAMAGSSGDPAGTGELNVATNLFKLEPDSIGGGLSYEFPLQVPKGRGGMTPDLRLQYTSQQGDDSSPFGYGWSINIPYIEHINRKGVDKLYASDDFFYSTLDGEIASTSASTMYGAKVENGDFRKYEYRNANTWIVTDKNGLVYKFGTSTASQVASTTQIYKWMLEEIRDPNDNYIKFEYFKDNNQAYPSRVVYTGSGSTDGVFEVRFIRESRSDIATSTKQGFTVVTKYRINQIQTIVDGTWVRKYNLGYIAGDNAARSLLNKIEESGLDTASTTSTLPANFFTHQASTTNWTASSTWAAPTTWDAARLADVNGDGLVDIIKENLVGTSTDKVYLNNGAGWTDTAGWSIPVALDTTNAVQVVDVNGDGYADIIKALQSDGQKYVYLNNATTTGWTLSSSWSFPEYLSTGTTTDLGTRIADVNGDSLPDVIRGDEAPNPDVLKVYFNTGSTWATSTWTLPIPLATDLNISKGTFFTDVNGDGMADLLEGFSAVNKGVYLNTGTGWLFEPTWEMPLQVTNNGFDIGTRFVDVNADGLVDIVRADATVPTNVVYINNGHGWTLTSGWTLPENIISNTGADTGV